MAALNPNQTISQIQAHLKAGRFAQALPLLQSVAKTPGGKKNASVFAAMAECHMGMNNVDQALTAIDKSIRLEPNNPRHRTNKGQALLHTRQLITAESTFREAIRLKRDWTPAILGLTETLHLCGRKDEAFELIEPLLGSEQASPQLDLAFGRLCAGKGRADEGIERLQRWVNDPAVHQTNRLLGLFMLGSLLDKQGRHDDAFETYHQANALRPGKFDAAERTKMTDQVIAGSTREAIEAIPTPANPSNKPIFIVGMPRSGTSLVEQILACHPRVFGAGELTAIDHAVQSLRQIDQGAMTPQALQKSIGRIASGYVGLLTRLSDGEEFVTDKNPMNFMHLGIISRLFPSARVIHCLRNPIDTCVSCYFHNFMGATAYTDDLASLGSYYNDYRRLMEHWKTVVQTPILDVVYEDVVADLEGSARRMLDFLELEWDPAVTRFNESDRVTTTASTDQVRQPIYATSVERWRRYEKHLGPLLGALDQAYRPAE